jgi:hypothetical protein
MVVPCPWYEQTMEMKFLMLDNTHCKQQRVR